MRKSCNLFSQACIGRYESHAIKMWLESTQYQQQQLSKKEMKIALLMSLHGKDAKNY